MRSIHFAFTALLVSIPAASAVSHSFDPLRHSGPASPYFDAPSQDDISDMPAGCVVDQAAYIVRHGSRYPEPGSFSGWKNLFAKFQNASYTATGPLAFIPSWAPPVDDVPHQPLFLSSTGALEAFALGVDLRKRYGFTKGGDNITIWSAAQQRVLDTATFFARGYLAQGNYLAAPSSNRGSIITLPDSVNYTFANSLTPSTGCPLYKTGDTGASSADAFRATYQNATANRLNTFLDGLALNASDIGAMQDLCGFQAEINGDTRFCDVFEDSEWLDYEYAHDLNYYYGSGPGNPFSATVGFPWVKAVSDLFALGPGKTTPGGNITPPALLMGFTHDNNLPPVISALGLWNTSGTPGVYPLSHTAPSPERRFRASLLVAFRGYVALERLACAAPAGPKATHAAGAGAAPAHAPGAASFVRVRVNRAPVVIPGCASGPGASCPLAQFTAYVDTTRARAAGDFVQRCGLQGAANATGEATFFTVAPPDMQELLVGLN
ncbi:phosphoglycerate mutase-like protein [Mycena belliarum]|uniref:Phosphoglycerate mutase-like protein n=1 Tax=Mycena belliarum TaxID=1033014 RepID=A0AAD6U2A8_9AGAR|nr:phosphoglycerate mutase-like protein [Mycena belliae]